MKSNGMKTACVTLEDVLVAASIRAASLVPETSGYLTLAVADATSRLPLGIEDRAVLLTTEGTVTIARRGPMLAAEAAGAAMRDVLARLLAVSAGTMPGLASAARPRAESDRGVEGVVVELEAALIPVNRAAARRALARLARETTRAREMGKIAAALRKAPPASAPISHREIGNTLVGFAPQPDPARAPARSVAAMPTLVAVDSAAESEISPNPVAAVLGEPTAAPAIVEPFVEEPFEPTPTALGMSVWTVEEPKVAAPSPGPMPSATETAPWRAIDDQVLSRLDIERLVAEPERRDETMIDSTAPVMTAAPPMAELAEASVPIHVEHVEASVPIHVEHVEPSVPIHVEHVEPSVPIHVEHIEPSVPIYAEQIAASELIAAPIEASEPVVEAAEESAVAPEVEDAPAVEACEASVPLEASEASVPLEASEASVPMVADAAFETSSPFRDVLSEELAFGPTSESPVLELYVEDLPNVGARLTLPWPVFNGEPEPDPMLVVMSGNEALTVPMPAELFVEALAASTIEESGEPIDYSDVRDAALADAEIAALEDEALRAIADAHAQGAAMAGDDPAAVAPYVFELLRRAARVSAPPPLPSVPERTRADDLLEQFTAAAPGDDKSLRAAASSLKALVGLDATPPPLLSFTPRPGAMPTPDLRAEGDARPSAAPAFVVPRTKRTRRVPLAVPLLCFALGMLAATAAVSALRPEIVSEVTGRIGRGAPPNAAPLVEKSNAATAEPRRASARAERDEKSPGRARTGN